jgi:hypothetical protein
VSTRGARTPVGWAVHRGACGDDARASVPASRPARSALRHLSARFTADFLYGRVREALRGSDGPRFAGHGRSAHRARRRRSRRDGREHLPVRCVPYCLGRWRPTRRRPPHDLGAAVLGQVRRNGAVRAAAPACGCWAARRATWRPGLSQLYAVEVPEFNSSVCRAIVSRTGAGTLRISRRGRVVSRRT